MSSSTRNTILVGDALDQLKGLADESIDMCLTSPPYFRLRNYGTDGQLGLENTVDIWVESLQMITTEIRRVLVPTGTFWLNLGDTYATRPSQGAPTKSLLMAPERVARRLQDDGWILRNKLIWAKPNPMPSSVKDRLTCTYEVIYVFAKQRSYFFDLDSSRIPHLTEPGTSHNRPAPTAKRETWRGPNADSTAGLTALKARGLVGHPLGKNPGDVWSIATTPGSGSHHAAFPESLAKRCIQAGAPESRCSTCKAPWRRAVQRLGAAATRLALQPTCTHGESTSEPGVVIDPFMGSGTTAVAATKLGRDWVGVELNPDFATEALDRIQASRSHAPPRSP